MRGLEGSSYGDVRWEGVYFIDRGISHTRIKNFSPR